MCALEALRRTRADGAFSNIVLDAVLRESKLSKADKAFATALYYGVLERNITLEYIINSFCNSGKKVAPLVMDCLKLGLYQIKYMDKIPQSAAVNETVKLAKKKCGGAAGFVNALLRRACREEVSLPEGDGAYALSIRYSCDKSLVMELKRELGTETAERFLADSLNSAPIYIRVNTLKTNQTDLAQRLGEICQCEPTGLPNALKLKGIGGLESNPLFEEGLFHVEDLAAQWAVKALDLQAGQRLLDMCSAPGGKAFSAAQHMENRGEIIACDLYENRVNLINGGAKRLGINIISAKVMDSTLHSPELGEFDRVLCDVPCSGLGIIRRKPDIKYKSADEFAELPRIQLAILQNGAKYLKKGGRLVYSTCTLRKEENRDVVDAFLAANPDFRLLPCFIAGESGGEKTFLPEIDGSDGFYVAVLIKE